MYSNGRLGFPTAIVERAVLQLPLVLNDEVLQVTMGRFGLATEAERSRFILYDSRSWERLVYGQFSSCSHVDVRSP